MELHTGAGNTIRLMPAQNVTMVKIAIPTAY